MSTNDPVGPPNDPVGPPIEYRVYGNGGGGGPIDYATPIATTTDVVWVSEPLDAPGRYAFGVRAFDPATGLGEANTDVAVRIVVDPAGEDRTGLPGPPRSVTLQPRPGGGCRIDWVDPPAPSRSVDRFRVVLGTGAAGDPVAVVSRVPGRLVYSATLPGPLAGGLYWAEVSAVNGAGIGPPSERASATLGLQAEPLSMGPITARVV